MFTRLFLVSRVLLLAGLPVILARGEDDPVKISPALPVLEITADGTATLRLNLEIAAPYHIYSTVTQLDSRGGGPTPTSVVVKSAELVNVDGALQSSPARKHYDPNFDLEVLTFEERAWIDVPLKGTASLKPGHYDAALVVSYQACNEELCLPPADVTVPFQISVGGKTAPLTADDPRWRQAEELAAGLNAPFPAGTTQAEHELGRDARMRRYADLAWELYQAHPDDARRWPAFEKIARGTIRFTKAVKPGYEASPSPDNLVIDEAARAQWKQRLAQVESDAATAKDAPASLRELFAAQKVSALVLPYTNGTLPPDWSARLVPPIEKLAADFPDRSAAFVYFSRLVSAVEAQDPAALPALIDRMSASPNARVSEYASQRRRVLLAMAHPLEMKFIALDGRAVDTMQWRGRVVLVDFWATWCVPCIESIPHLKEVYARYHEHGLEIVNVSVDNANARPALEKLVAKLGMPWPQFFDGQALKTEYAVRYGVQPIPHLLVAGPDGMIVAVNPTPEKLDAEIRRLLKL